MRSSTIRFIPVLLLLFFGAIVPGVAQTYTPETVPNPKQNPSSVYVSNPDHILSGKAVEQLNSVLGRLEDSTTAQVAVVCLNSIGEVVPKDFATTLFRKWGLGYRQKNNGLLILLVNDQHRIEMETGYGLEGILPDAICRRIQTEKMIPFARTGDYDQAITSGVAEVARLVSEPETAKEVYDASKDSYRANQPLDNSAIFVLFLLLIPFLLVLRLVGFFLKKTNPVTEQIEKALLANKWRFVRAFVLYSIMPVCVGLGVIYLRKPLALHGWEILLILYTCVGAVQWYGRRCRKNTFAKLFGTLTESDQYVRQQAARLNGWGNILLFPIPFWWLKRTDAQALDALRNHARTSAEGVELIKVAIAERDTFLTEYQQVEQHLGTVDYDVWRSETYNITQAIGYRNLSDTVHQDCPVCQSRALYLSNTRTIKEATAEREGRGMNEYTCKACEHHTETQYTIARVSRATPTKSTSSSTYSSSGSSSSNSWGSSSSSNSSSSSSSWGGGNSGGGGAGSSW